MLSLEFQNGTGLRLNCDYIYFDIKTPKKKTWGRQHRTKPAKLKLKNLSAYTSIVVIPWIEWMKKRKIKTLAWREQWLKCLCDKNKEYQWKYHSIFIPYFKLLICKWFLFSPFHYTPTMLRILIRRRKKKEEGESHK